MITTSDKGLGRPSSSREKLAINVKKKCISLKYQHDHRNYSIPFFKNTAS